MNDWIAWLSLPGWFGTRAPRAADLVIAALALVVPLFWWAAGQAARRTRLHAALMSTLYLALTVVVVGFVLWARTGSPPAPRLEAAWFYRPLYLPLLGLHIVAALASLALGAAAIGWAVAFGRQPDGSPGFSEPERAATHRRIGRAYLRLLTATALTGAIVYLCRYVY